MARAPFQVLVIPFRILGDRIQYAMFRRGDMSSDCWQWIAGGGEEGETPDAAARREAFEEAGISADADLIPLESHTTIPVVHVCGFRWGPDVLVIPEWSFGSEAGESSLVLSAEHTEVRWVSYEEAVDLLRWDSNRNALWELDERLRRGRAGS